MGRLTAREIQGLVPLLTHDDRAIQLHALKAFAEHARVLLADVPEYWRFLFPAYPKDELDIRAEYDKKGLPYPQWRLDDFDSVSGLVHAMKTCDDHKARQWHLAALLLQHCLGALQTGDPHLIAFIPTLALRRDAERGRKVAKGASDGHKAVHGTSEDAATRRAQLRAEYLALRPGKPHASDTLRAVAKRHKVTERTVRRAFEKIGQTPP